MPRFYLDLDTAGEVSRDIDGTELASLAVACYEAVGAIAQAARDELPLRRSASFVATLRSEQGEAIFRAELNFSQTIGNNPARGHNDPGGAVASSQ